MTQISPMIYSVRHTTTFRYEPAVRESVMEVRLQPRSDGEQRCLSFTLDVDPAANIMQYRDFTGNTVHHFDIAGRHSVVKVTAQSTVEVQSVPAPRPSDSGDWADLDALVAANDSLGDAVAQPLRALQRAAGAAGEGTALRAPGQSADVAHGISTRRSTSCSPTCRTARKWILRLKRRYSAAGRVPGLCPHHDRAGAAAARFRAATSAATCFTATNRDEKTARSKAHRTPGLRRWCRGWDGWRLIPPTIWSEATATFASPLAATMPTFLRRAASTKAKRRAN